MTMKTLCGVVAGAPGTLVGIIIGVVILAANAQAQSAGWAGNGAYGYPGASPPTAFRHDVRLKTDKATGKTTREIQKSEGILWYVDNLYFGHAQPVPVQDMVLVNREPYELIALNATDGSVRWKADSSQEPYLDDAGRKRLGELRERQKKLDELLAGFPERVNALKAALEATDEGKAFLQTPNWKVPFQGERAPEKDFTPTPPADEKLAETYRVLAKAIADNGLKPFGKTWSYDVQRNRHLFPHIVEMADKFSEWPCQGAWTTLVGAGFATPLVNGDRIYVANSANVVACYDLTGKKIWGVWDHTSRSDKKDAPLTRELEFCPSPILVGNILVVAQDFNRIRAYEAATGKKLWENIRPKRGGWTAGTPAGMTVNGVPVVIDANGMVYRLKDGVVLTDGLPAATGTIGPIVDGDSVFMRGFTITKGRRAEKPVLGAYRLAIHGDQAEVTTRWISPHVGNEHRSPVLHQGHLYHINEAKTDEIPARALYALKADDGVLVGSEPLSQGGYSYPCLLVADTGVVVGTVFGKFMFFSFAPELKPIGEGSVFLRAYGSYPCYALPTFHGDRIYQRDMDGLYCIGR